jgi:hypothetical protein
LFCHFAGKTDNKEALLELDERLRTIDKEITSICTNHQTVLDILAAFRRDLAALPTPHLDKLDICKLPHTFARTDKALANVWSSRSSPPGLFGCLPLVSNADKPANYDEK